MFLGVWLLEEYKLKRVKQHKASVSKCSKAPNPRKEEKYLFGLFIRLNLGINHNIYYNLPMKVTIHRSWAKVLDEEFCLCYIGLSFQKM